jgi:Rieske Fe-S protein
MTEQVGHHSEDAGEAGGVGRRSFLRSAASVAMTGGLVASYGTCGVMAARFLYPVEGRATRWQFVTETSRMRAGDALTYRTPAGETVTVARRGVGDAASDFIALSSTCPHLGCQVHWEAHRNRFFCPCHNGVFDPSGTPLEGPPAEAGQRLPEYPLKIEGGLLFIDVPLDQVATLERERDDRGHPGPSAT